MTVYPNQKVITIHKEKCEDNFLQVNNTNWQVACEKLTYSAFKIYLYMASNQNGYTFALSYEDVNCSVPMSRKTYDKAIKELKNQGYLENIKDQMWRFSDA